jgi:hypothetical protein
MEKEKLISRIISQEWKMFADVHNIGGRASCQDDPKTFKIMRHAQAMSWSKNTLESYLNDLKNAESCGRNMMTEKYARMMASTSPVEYNKIKQCLPPVDPEISDIIEVVIEQVLAWEEELIEQYPHIRKRGRSIYSRDDTINATSLETYLRGELLTFSLKTIKLYQQDVESYAADNKNMCEIILEETMKKYGIASLRAADERLKKDFF